MAERCTASAQSPSYVHFFDQSCHHDVVRVSAQAGLVGWGTLSCDGNHASVKATRSPRRTVKSATVERPTPRVSTGVWRTSASGPAIATRAPWTLRTHGMIEP